MRFSRIWLKVSCYEAQGSGQNMLMCNGPQRKCIQTAFMAVHEHRIRVYLAALGRSEEVAEGREVRMGLYSHPKYHLYTSHTRYLALRSSLRSTGPCRRHTPGPAPRTAPSRRETGASGSAPNRGRP